MFLPHTRGLWNSPTAGKHLYDAWVHRVFLVIISDHAEESQAGPLNPLGYDRLGVGICSTTGPVKSEHHAQKTLVLKENIFAESTDGETPCPEDLGATESTSRAVLLVGAQSRFIARPCWPPSNVGCTKQGLPRLAVSPRAVAEPAAPSDGARTSTAKSQGVSRTRHVPVPPMPPQGTNGATKAPPQEFKVRRVASQSFGVKSGPAPPSTRLTQSGNEAKPNQHVVRHCQKRQPVTCCCNWLAAHVAPVCSKIAD